MIGSLAVGGWSALTSPTAITTLAAVNGADAQTIQSWLIAEHGIVTTFADVQRAPFELQTPVLAGVAAYRRHRRGSGDLVEALSVAASLCQ